MNDMPEDTNNLRPGGASAYQSSMEARVAVLEEIARNTAKVLDRLEATMARMDDRMTRLEDRQSADFKWLLGTQLGIATFIFATLAHGFHWF